MTTALRLERESVLRCPHCQDAPYHVYRRQVRRADGTPGDVFEHVLWPSGSGVLPPRDPEKITCPDCGDELRRVTG